MRCRPLARVTSAGQRAFCRLGQHRAVATRYDKRDFVYRSTVEVAAIRIWLRDLTQQDLRDTPSPVQVIRELAGSQQAAPTAPDGVTELPGSSASVCCARPMPIFDRNRIARPWLFITGGSRKPCDVLRDPGIGCGQTALSVGGP